MRTRDNLIGERFGRLLVVEFIGSRDKRRWWRCVCDCGAEKELHTQGIHQVFSCGCLRRENTGKMFTAHGAAKNGKLTPEYRAWVSMKGRCKYTNRPDYKYYGANGISVCDEWMNDFPAFLAHVGPKPTAKHSLDRINPWGNYEPGNVRWATVSEQNTNKRKHRV